MGSKDTKALESELVSQRNLEGFLKANENELCTKSVSEFLNEMLIRYNTEKNEVIRRAEMAGTYGYQIFDGSKKAGRDKLLQLAFGFPLTKDETDYVLRCAGYAALYVRNSRDALLIYALYKQYDIRKTNELLYEQGEKLFNNC